MGTWPRANATARRLQPRQPQAAAAKLTAWETTEVQPNKRSNDEYMKKPTDVSSQQEDSHRFFAATDVRPASHQHPTANIRPHSAHASQESPHVAQSRGGIDSIAHCLSRRKAPCPPKEKGPCPPSYRCVRTATELAHAIRMQRQSVIGRLLVRLLFPNV